ncbi:MULTISPECIES: hypothetical protein [unclassified Nitrospina]|uniref:hypothetical protein n=1 Tax=unclassified Nitrospina TaxID=2638683 RepID=UPI003F9CDF4B
MNTHNQNHEHSFTGNIGEPQSHRNESGAVLVVVLLMMVVLIGLIPAAINMTRNDYTRTANYQESKEAFYISEAGVQEAIRMTKTMSRDTILGTNAGLLEPGGTVVSFNGANYNEYNYANGTYKIRVDDNTEPDGDTTTDTDKVLVVTAVGTSNTGVEKTIRANIYKFDLPPSTFPSALTMVGPLSAVNISGNSFEVNGADQAGGNGLDLSGNPDASCPGKAAVAFESSGPVTEVSNMNQCSTAATNTCVEVPNGNANSNDGNYTGVNSNTRDFQTSQSTFSSADSTELHQVLTADGDNDGTPDLVSNYYTGNQIFSGGAYGTDASPQITYVTGDLKMTGNLTGSGILIVDGNLTLSGTVNWNGVILVGACTTCSSTATDTTGVGSGTINGALVVGNGTQAQADIRGNFAINYSCEGINLANAVFNDNVSVVDWFETGA